MRDANPRRVNPAAASTRASCAPSSSLRNRVSRLPRIPVKRAPGNTRISCAMRRTLPVPIDGLAPRDATRSSIDETVRLTPDTTPVVSGFSRTGNTTASSGFSRGSTPAIVRPSGRITDMSLLLWTARSIWPPSSASSISLTKSPLPPISESGRSCRRSPSVLMITISQAGPPAAAMRAATVLACHSASRLPRVPRRRATASAAVRPMGAGTARRARSGRRHPRADRARGYR